MNPDSLPFVWGGPAGHGLLRAEPADFRVDEVLGFEPDGAGEHAFVQIRKVSANTEDVAMALARFSGVRRRDVSYSGMKDNRAETVQWFSVHLPGQDDPDWAAFAGAQWSVLRAARHGRKLRTGTHVANRFVLRVREFSGDAGLLYARAETVRRCGFPNGFGPQRFGRGGENIRKARQMFAGTGRAGRRLRGLYLSAARSVLFNQVLAARIEAANWCTPHPGDALMLEGSRSMFPCTGSEPDLAARIEACDLHVTGPLWGEGVPVVSEEQLHHERELLATWIDLVTGLESARMRADRRPLRAVAPDLAVSIDNDSVELAFSLPPGSFATALVRELLDTTIPGT